MKNITLIALAIFLASISSCSQNEPQTNKNRLWYTSPASNWNEALPVGNGRLGAMDFGGVYKQQIQFNEESLWAGKKINSNNPDALKDLSKIRKLIFEGKINQAYKLGNHSLLGTPPRFRSYQTFGDLIMNFDNKGQYSNYRRDLCLNNGISTTTFTIDGVKFTKELFVSAPDNTIVVHLSADKPGRINTKISLKRERDAIVTAKDNYILMNGQIIDKDTKDEGEGGDNMKFAARMIVQNKGGEITSGDRILTVKDADEITLLLTAATDYNLSKLNFDRSIKPAAICSEIISKAEKKSYQKIKSSHIKDHSKIFERVKIDLGGNESDTIPTDQRLIAVKSGGEDPALIALYYQYGRYLLMGSSRSPGVLPANLQGVWNNHLKAPWNSDYHTNINLQMNYWPAEICNLSETAIPLANLVDRWRTPGRISAKEMYGCSGWMMHHTSNIFGYTPPVGDLRWSMSPLSGVWMTVPLYRHYEFTEDIDYLRNKAYPVMKEAMEFIADFLVEKDGYLVSTPSMSPENSYLLPGSKKPNQITYAPTIDNQLLVAHINNSIEAANTLGIDRELVSKWKSILAKIPPVKIGKDSTIMEWIEDYDEREPGHRHMSHLMGLHPLAQITPETPELFEAAKKTIEKRLKNGGGHTGWSRAWIINFYARMRQPETAYNHVLALLRKSTLTNLFDNHPPFQIDGNFGGTAGITEMLLQSHMRDTKGDYIQDILPALPGEWANGKITGIKGRGNFEISIKWESGKLISVSVKSIIGNRLNIRYNDKIITKDTEAGKVYSFTANSFTN